MSFIILENFHPSSIINLKNSSYNLCPTLTFIRILILILCNIVMYIHSDGVSISISKHTPTKAAWIVLV